MKPWYSIHNPTNPLLAAAAPLYSLGATLHNATLTCPAKTLRTELLQAIHHFEQSAQTHTYPPHVVTAARYVLCLWLDGLLTHTAWGGDQHWNHQPLLSHFPETTWGANRLWILLKQAQQDPQTYIDLMELLYSCFRLGLTTPHTQAADRIKRVDALYTCIRRYRDADPVPLFQHTPTTSVPKRRGVPSYYNGIAACLMALAFSAGLFFQVHQQLAQHTSWVTQRLSHLDHPVARRATS